jgi:superfamily II DNA or RNA helicase
VRVQVEFRNVSCRIVRADDYERDWLRHLLTFRAVGATGVERPMCLLDETAGEFPSGFLPIVQSRAAKELRTLDVLDLRPVSPARDEGVDVSWLRDYQRAALEAVCARERGILWLPTAAGKTATASSIVASFPQARWLFLVHRLSLLNQTAESFRKFTGELAGKVGESGWRPRRFTVATFQTLAARLAHGDVEARALLESVDGVIVDEAHALAASTFTTVMGVATNARYRIGLSGTPLARGDRKSSLVVGATGPVIYRMRPEVLVEREVLARPTILMADCWQDELEDATWPTVYDRLVVHSARRNTLVVEAVRRSEKPALVFVQAVEHGQVLMRAFARAGIRAGYVHGAHTTEQREAAIAQLVEGRIDVLVCSVIFQEGVDVPALRSVIIAAGGQSTIAAIQRVGRGLRKSEGKTSCMVWEVNDRGQRWLEAHARARRLAYQAEGYEVRVEHLGDSE